ncbi:probable glutamate receptor [Palaemon carinicauda]|uniref:probable glutamate receptor n=1 Tax=Palaemon carinicauda TaxID=392227 RepID=UPI0035B64934
MGLVNSSKCLVLGVFTWMPHIIAVGDSSTPKVTGTMLEVLDIFAERLDFCYKFLVPKDKAAGALLPNGTWTGAMQLLQEKKIDFMGMGMGVNADRALAADVSEYLFMDEWTAAYKRPELESDIAGFVKPYKAEAWVGVFLALVTVIITLFVVRIISDKTHREEGEEDLLEASEDYGGGKSSSPFYDAVMWSVGSLLSQSISKSPKGEAVRLIIGLWLLITLILGTVYRSNLKAMLILPKIQLPFNSLEQVVQSGLPVWTPTDAMLHETAMKSPSNTTLGRIRKQFICVDAPTNEAFAIDGMNKGKFVLTAPKSAVAQVFHSTFSMTGRCVSFAVAESYFKTSILCILLPKGSPWKAKLDPIIVRLREAGILKRAYLKGVQNSTECLKPISSKSNTSLRPLDLGDFYGVFSVFGAGILAVLMSFVAELLLGSQEKKEAEAAKLQRIPGTHRQAKGISYD